MDSVETLRAEVVILNSLLIFEPITRNIFDLLQVRGGPDPIENHIDYSRDTCWSSSPLDITPACENCSLGRKIAFEEQKEAL